jgi:hypothetical protein
MAQIQRRQDPQYPPTQRYDVLYVGTHRYPGTNPEPVGNKPHNVDANTKHDLYQSALLFAAANAMARQQGRTVKVALLGDSVFAVHLGSGADPLDNHSKAQSQPGQRPSVYDLIMGTGGLPASVDIWC